MLKKPLLAVLALIPLSGCIAAAPALYMAASYAVAGLGLYQVYSIGNVEDAKYKIQESSVSNAAVEEIKAATTLAIYPTNTAVDGEVVDIFNQRSDLNTVSSRTTIEWVESTGMTQDKLRSFPSSDRAQEIQKFSSSVGSDLVVFAVIEGGKADTSGMLWFGDGGFRVNVVLKIYSGASGAVIVDEIHEIEVDTGDAPSDNDYARLAATGISDRISEIRKSQATVSGA